MNSVSFSRSSLGESVGDLPELRHATHDNLYGGKARNLARLIDIGIPVPEGFVIGDDLFKQHLRATDLGAWIEQTVANLDHGDPEGIRSASERIRARVEAAPIEDTLFGAIEYRWKTLSTGGDCIVRSSAIGEDSVEFSFAGQLDSIGGIHDSSRLHSSILGCWASFWSSRSLSYQNATGASLAGLGLIVQRQVHARYSGVLFTSPPAEEPSAGNNMVAEYCYGNGAALVSGEINPGRFVVSRKGADWRLLTEPEQGTSSDDAPIDDRIVGQLREYALHIEKSFEAPQDIEWAVDPSGELFVVQARPITVVGSDLSGRRMVTWSNANINENYPDPVSPLLYSIAGQAYTHYFRNLGLALGVSRKRIRRMEDAFNCIVGVHGGRLYYNLTSIHDILRMAPFGDELVQHFNTFVGAAETTAPSSSAQDFSTATRSRLILAAEFLRILARTSTRLARLRSGIERFEKTVEEYARDTAESELQSKNELELADDLKRFMEIRLNRWTDASIADGASMLSYGLLTNLLDRWDPASSRDNDHSAVLSGLDNLVSAEPVISLWALSERVRSCTELKLIFEDTPAADIIAQLEKQEDGSTARLFLEELETYFDQFGFRCSGELMLTTPSFMEQPEGLLEIIKGSIHRSDASPLEVIHRQKQERLTQTARLLQRLKAKPVLKWLPWPRRASVIRRILAWAQSAISFRERARLKQSLLYSRLRGVVLAIGERFYRRGVLRKREDIFFLTMGEIEDLIRGRFMFPAAVGDLVELRALEQQRLAAMKVEDSFTLAEGRYLHATETGETSSQADDVLSLKELRGVCACAGSVTAKAAVLDDVTEAARLREGDILVTHQTDPGWGPVFFLIKGLVIERGGMLSHGAILAREFGIPAVVGVKDATRVIHHGSSITLHAGEGLVSIND